MNHRLKKRLKFEKKLMAAQSKTSKRKGKKVFISHNSLDASFCNPLFELISTVVERDKIFYSSNPWYGVPNGKDLLQVMKDQYDNYTLFMIIVSSPRYYTSPKSLNEMGAAWVLNSKIDVFMTADGKVGDMKGVINSDYIAICATDSQLSTRLDLFRDELVSFFNTEAPDPDIWKKEKKKFIKKIKSINYDSEESPALTDNNDTYTDEKREIDRRTISRLFSHISWRLMDEYVNSSLQYLDERLPRAYEWWQYHTNLITFNIYDKKLAKLIEDFSKTWDTIMYDNWKYYSPSEKKRGYYEFHGFNTCVLRPSSKEFMKLCIAQNARPNLKKAMKDLLDFVREAFPMDLMTMSENFEQNPE